MRIQDKNMRNSIRSKNYPESKALRELEKFNIDWLVYCYKAKRFVQWAEEHIRKDVCKLNSKISLHNTKIGSSFLPYSVYCTFSNVNVTELRK